MTDMNSASGRGLLLNCTPGFANRGSGLPLRCSRLKLHLASVTLGITAKEVNDDRTPRPICLNHWRRSYGSRVCRSSGYTSKQRYRYITNIASVIVLLRCKPHRQCSAQCLDGCMSCRRVVGPFRSVYCLILPRRQGRKDHFSLQKCPEIRYFNVDFLKIFLGT